ncbi:hypothetical protein DM02DRAFT_619303 [Periconia macrospinosa]|uniref:Uncharacterized protein n=1 Tax=Periconia macrospinosa TaxID=97972 RepID=A0A2V1D5U6_9PLEO|nr:hypothetical protein DM02DRAFT_619303 [Periconia macrospinosa]
MAGATSYLQNRPHISQAISPARYRSASPAAASARNLGRRPETGNNDPGRPSMAVSRASSENVVKVFSSLPTVFDFADYTTTRGNVPGDTQIFINLIQRVRHDVAEVSRLYETRAVTEYLKAWPDKKLGIDTILLDIQRALNEIGTMMEAVRIAGDDGGPASLRRKFEWVISHQKQFLRKQQHLASCHQSLTGTLQVFYTTDRSFATREEGDDILQGPHSRHRFRLSLQNNSLPSILVSGVEANHIDMPASNSPVELPGSTPEDLPDPDSWDLYAPPRRQRSLSASAVSTSPTAMNVPEVKVSAQTKPVQVYIAYNPTFSTIPAKPRVTDTNETNPYDPDKEDERAANAPEVVPIVAPEVVASPIDDSSLTQQVVTLQLDQSGIPPPMISPLAESHPRLDHSNSNQDTPAQESNQKQFRSIITQWPARSSSKVPPQVPSPRKTFHKIKPLPLYTRSKSSDAIRRPRALSESLRNLEDKARASFDSKPRPMPTVEEKPTEVYSTAASVRLSAVSLLPAENKGPRVKEVTVKKPPTRSQTLPMELPDFSSTGSLMEELSHWVLPPGARTSYHSLDTNGSLDASTPATSAGGSPVTNNSRDTKETELVVVSSNAAVSAEAIKSPHSMFRLFPSTPTTPGLPTRAPPPLPKDLLPRIEKPKMLVLEKPAITRPNESTPISPEGPAPKLPPRPRLEVTEPSNEELQNTNAPEVEEPAPALPPRPAPQRSLSPSGPPISLESPLPSPQGPLPALPLRRLSPQASSSSLSTEEGNSTKSLKRSRKPRISIRPNVSRVRSPSPQFQEDRSPTPQPQSRAPSPADKALPIPPELRSLSEQLKQPEPTPVTPSETSRPTRAKVDVTMEAHPGTLVKVVPSFPHSAPSEPGSPPPTASGNMMELPPIEISHSHPEVVPGGCDGVSAREAETKCESKVTAQTKRRRAQARRMRAAVADD